MNKNWRLHFILCLIGLFIILAGAFMLLKWPTEKENEKKPKYLDGKIESSYVKEVIDRFASEILFKGDESFLKESSLVKNIDDLTLGIFADFNSTYKLYFVLESFSSEKVAYEEAKTKYYDYFNEEIPEDKEVSLCSSFSLKDDYYHKTKSCQNKNTKNIMIYKKEHTRQGEKAYLELYVGVQDGDVTYIDYEMKNKYNDPLEKITEDNYEAFSKYLLTLKVNEDGLYYFVSLVKVS